MQRTRTGNHSRETDADGTQRGTHETGVLLVRVNVDHSNEMCSITLDDPHGS